MEPIEERLSKIEAMLHQLVERQAKPYYTAEEFAKLVGREAFTCREILPPRPHPGTKESQRSR